MKKKRNKRNTRKRINKVEERKKNCADFISFYSLCKNSFQGVCKAVIEIVAKKKRKKEKEKKLEE